MKLLAWPVEPPGFGSMPFSRSTMSRQPRRARCQAMLLPTIPAPMTTTRARSGSGLMRGNPPGRADPEGRVGAAIGGEYRARSVPPPAALTFGPPAVTSEFDDSLRAHRHLMDGRDLARTVEADHVRGEQPGPVDARAIVLDADVSRELEDEAG